MGGFEYLEHASDVRIRAWGADLSDTAGMLIRAFWRLVAEPQNVPPEKEARVSVTAQDRHELIVNLLNEQIFLVDADGFVARDVLSVAVMESDCGSRESREGFRATAILSGALVESMTTPLMRYFKAATYHDLLVNGREIIVTLDI